MIRYPNGFSTAESDLDRASRDFGGVVTHRPAAVARPKTLDDVASVLAFANRENVRVAPRGEGHTSRGQSMVEGGISLETAELDWIRVDGETVVAGAGAKWSDVLDATARTHKTPPVLTDYLALSVGGTLSVGGVGGRSFAHGLQSCNVMELTVVTGGGDIVRCSRDEHADLFDACRGGMGQCAVIVEARMKLVDAPRRARVAELSYDRIETLLADQRLCAETQRFDYILLSTPVDSSGRWVLKLELVHYHAGATSIDDDALLEGLSFASSSVHDVTYLEHATRLSAFEAAFKAGAFHPWMDLFVPGSAVPSLLRAAHAELDPRSFMDGHLMTYPLLRSRCDSPILTLSDEPYFVLFDVLPTVAERKDLADMEQRCQRLLEIARASGARVYPIGYPVGTAEMSNADYRRQLVWEKFEHAKKSFDPRGILTPSPRVFE